MFTLKFAAHTLHIRLPVRRLNRRLKKEASVQFRVKADAGNLEQLHALAAFSPVLNTLTQGTRVNIDVADAATTY